MDIVGIAGDMRADEGHAEQAAPESIKHGLDQQQAKGVKLKLSSGQDLEGTSASVTTQTVRVTQLSGVDVLRRSSGSIM
jgi:hypothetical protein